MIVPLVFVATVLQGQQRGGPPAVFRTEVPASALNVVAGAPTRTSVLLSVLSAANATVELVYQAKGNNAQQVRQDLKAGVPTEVALTGLKPDTEYSYTATLSDGNKLTGKFRTAREAKQGFTFVIQADSHLDNNSDVYVYRRTIQNMVKDNPDFVVDLGDTFMVDKYPTYTDAAKQYQAQRYWFSLLGSQMSVFLCLGNHDGETGWRSRGGTSTTPWSQEQRQTYFPTIRPNGFYSGAPKRGLYYEWTWGDAQFLVLDPFVATTQKTRSDEDGWNWTLGADQFKWFESSLKTSKAKYKFVFIHHLVGGFGREARGGTEAIDRFEWGDKKGFQDHRQGWAEPIHSLMVKYGVTAMFHGHDHLYVRQERDGITYLEVPQPSHGRGDQTSSAKEYGYTTGTLLGSSGHIRVTVGTDGAKLEYVKSQPSNRNGQVVDSLLMKSRL